MILALLPVKELSQAKQRLASLLSPAERHALCLAMFRDVVAALQSAHRLDAILVYTGDAEVLALASALGVTAVAEPVGYGQSAAIAAAIPLCRDRGATTILTIPVDTPLLTGGDVDSLVAFAAAVALPPPSAVMVPSADGTGTNALLLTPPEALPPRFGPDSLARHTAGARERGVAYRHHALPRLALDVDSPADLAALLVAAERSPSPPRWTYQLLRGELADRCRVLV